MRKKEAINYIEKTVGYCSPKLLFDLYDDDSEIPQGLIDLYLTDGKKGAADGSFMIVGKEVKDVLDKLI